MDCHSASHIRLSWLIRQHEKCNKATTLHRSREIVSVFVCECLWIVILPLVSIFMKTTRTQKQLRLSTTKENHHYCPIAFVVQILRFNDDQSYYKIMHILSYAEEEQRTHISLQYVPYSTCSILVSNLILLMFIARTSIES